MDLYGFFLRRLLFAKKTIFFALFPFALTLLIFAPRHSLEPLAYFQEIFAFIYLSSMGVFIPMYFGTRAFGEEIENQTIVYPLTRPRPRGEYLLAKYLAAATASCILLIPFAMLGAATLSREQESPLWMQDSLLLAASLAGAAFVYTAFFLAIGVGLKRPVVFGVIVTFVWENFISLLPGIFKEFTAMHFFRSILIRGYEVDRFLNMDVPVDLPTQTTAFIVFGSVIAASLTTAWILLRKKEFI